MKQKELIISVIKEYSNTKNVAGNIPGGSRPNLKRGNRHVISHYLEDIIGAFIADLLPPEIYEIWIEQTFYTEGSKNQFKPDVVILKKQGSDKKIVGLFEVKDSANPFRWKEKKMENKGIEYIKKRTGQIKQIKKVGLSYKNGENAKNKKLQISEEVILDLVLFSDRLYSKLDKLKNYCHNDPASELHLLLKGYHPNPDFNNISLDALIDAIKNDTDGLIYDEESLRKRINEIQRIR